MNFYKNIFYFILLSFLFSSCSEKSDNSSNETTGSGNDKIENESSNNNGNGNTIVASTLSGKVVDGYIQNASVCIDTNSNLLCDNNEKVAISNEKGEYSFTSISLAEDKIIPIISTNGQDTSTNENFNEVIIGFLSTYDTKESYETIVTPATDLIIRQAVRENFSNIFIFSSSDIADPMTNKVNFVLTQKLQHIKNLIKSSNSLITMEDIKNEILNQNLRLDIDSLNISTIFANLEAKLNISIDTTKKDFINAQITENKNVINELKFDDFIDTKELSNIQISINNDMKKVHEKLNNFDNNANVINLENFKNILKQSKINIKIPKNKFYDTPPAFPELIK